MKEIAQGHLRKLKSQLTSPVQYQLPLGDQLLDLNPYIGSEVKFVFSGKINCISCGRKTNKSFSQGYCYPCMKSKAACDVCIMSPEKCHYAQGTCREPEWAQAHCMQDHIVYLSNTTGIKVGITRHEQVPTRWIDQGAVQALPVMRVSQRFYSGLAEVAFKEFVNDRTQWQRLLKGNPEEVDLPAEFDKLLDQLNPIFEELKSQYGELDFQIIDSPEVVNIEYPVEQFPEKVKAHNFDKTPEVTGVLQGIKGQYLILDTGVLNVRKFTAYEVSFSAA